MGVAGKELLRFRSTEKTHMDFLWTIIIDSLSLITILYPALITKQEAEQRPSYAHHRRHRGGVPGLGQVRPALLVPHGAPLYRHGVPVIGQGGGVGRAGALVADTAYRILRPTYLTWPAAWWTNCGRPRGQKPPTCPRLFRPADYTAQEYSDGKH